MGLQQTMILGFSLPQIAFGVILFLVSLVVTSAIVTAFILWIPPDHFVAKKRGLQRRITSPFLRVAAIIGKNLLGVLLIVAGLVLSLPGVPGQGILTMLVGLLLLDIPGKRRFELALVRRAPVHRVIDKIRARFSRAPLVLEPATGDPPADRLRPEAEPADSEPGSDSASR
jgi:hypothetical protein